MPDTKGIYRERDGGLVYNNRIPVIKKQNSKRKKKNWNFRFITSGIDKPFLILILVLLVFGIVMMFSASFAWGLSDEGDGYFYARKQVIFALMGLTGMLLVSFLDYHFYQNASICYAFYIIMFIVTVYAALFGSSTADASRWIDLGFVQFQPSELLKVAFIIIFAYIMSVNYRKFTDWRYCVIPFMIILGITVGVLVMQRHLSAVLIVGVIGVSMMFVSSMPANTFSKRILTFRL